MKRIILSAALIAAIISSGARAAEFKEFQLSANDLALIGQGLAGMDAYSKVVKNTSGQDISVSVPYDIGGARLSIARDETAIRNALTDFRTAASKIVSGSKDGAASQSKDDQDKATADANAKISALADQKQPIQLIQIDAKDLKFDANPFPPSLLSEIEPLLVGM